MTQPATAMISARKGVITASTTTTTWLLLGAIAAIAAALRAHSLPSGDVAWILTLAERTLDGRRDFVEVNPPGAIFAYVPAVWLARNLGLSPEATCDVLVFLVAVLSAMLSSRVIRHTFSKQRDVSFFAAGLAAILLLLPSYAFGQREHWGTMLVLPWIAALAVRTRGESPAMALRVVAGLACGLSVVIKPHFGLMVGAALVFAMWRFRTVRYLSTTENWIAAAVVVTYGVAIWIMFPDFFTQTLPLAAAVYLPDRLDLLTMLSLPAVYLFACAVILILALGGSRFAFAGLLLAAALAGAAAFVLQGKGWPYQSYPAIAFALLAFVWLAAHHGEWAVTRSRFVFLAAGVPLFAGGMAWFGIDATRDPHAIAQAITRIAERPSIAAVGGNLSIGFPLVRLVGGTWAQRSPALWITLAAHQVRQRTDVSAATSATLDHYEAQDREGFRDDMRQNQPQILLIDVKTPSDFDWLAWLRADPRTAWVLEAYEFVEQLQDVQIWRRRRPIL